MLLITRFLHIKKILTAAILIASVSIFICLPANAQKSKKQLSKEKSKSKSFDWQEKVWFGGGLGLSFSSAYLSNDAPGQVFNISLSPMAGYKIKSFWSVGPRISYSYTNARFDNGEILKLSIHDVGAGLFTRLKFFKLFFVHGEYESAWTRELTGYLTSNNKLETIGVRKDHIYGGLGYNSSGDSDFGYEIYVLYDFLAEDNTIQLPITFRAGLTYRF